MDMSDCGVGKMWMACAALKELRLPTLVVCPKVIQSQWREVSAVFDDSHSVIGYELLRTGNTPYGWWENPLPAERHEYFVCQTCQLKVDMDNFQPCYAHPKGWHCLIRKKEPWNYGKFIFDDAVQCVVYDEIHRCRGAETLNEKMLLAAKRQKKKILGLSATLASSPLDLHGLGYVLGLHNMSSDLLTVGMKLARPSYRRWYSKYGVRFDPAFGGLKWFVADNKKVEIMSEIRQSIIPTRGVRIAKADLPDFPAVEIFSELYDVAEADKINKLYEQMAAALVVLDERKLLDVDPSSPLTAGLRERQAIELLKVPVAVELLESYLEQGISAGVFINFRQTMEELRRRLNCDCFIDGSPEGVRNRGRAISDFQANRAQLILVNNDAGRESLSLHDLHGGHPRGGLVFPGQKADGLRQVFGRFPRNGAKSKSFYRVIFAAGTVETKMHRALRSKLNCLDSLNDGDLNPLNLT